MKEDLFEGVYFETDRRSLFIILNRNEVLFLKRCSKRKRLEKLNFKKKCKSISPNYRHFEITFLLAMENYDFIPFSHFYTTNANSQAILECFFFLDFW